MPIFELGYRHWEGKLSPPFFRWWAISWSGIKLAFRSKWLRRIAIFSFAPILYLAAFFFILGYVTEDPRRNIQFRVFIESVIGEQLGGFVGENPEKVRHYIWSEAFFGLLGSLQLWIMLTVVGFVGPGLISNDIKSKAFLLYYSKPITLLEYFIGKCFAVLVAIAAVTLIPNLVLYIVSIAVSPTIDALWQTWDMVPRIFISFFVVAIPSTLIVLFFSSLTSDHRYATFCWYGLCTVGGVFQSIIIQSTRDGDWAALISLKSNLAALIYWAFDMEGLSRQFQALELGRFIGAEYDVSGASIVILFTCIFCLYWIGRRLLAPVRI